jgi:hypothetical protein
MMFAMLRQHSVESRTLKIVIVINGVVIAKRPQVFKRLRKRSIGSTSKPAYSSRSKP